MDLITVHLDKQFLMGNRIESLLEIYVYYVSCQFVIYFLLGL